MNKKTILPIIFFLAVFMIVIALVIKHKNASNLEINRQFNRLSSVISEDASIEPINPSKDLIRGNPDAEVLIVEYGDLQCPFCYQQHPVLQKFVFSDYVLGGSVAWVFRHYTHIDDVSYKKARFIECTRRQYGNNIAWKFLDKILTPIGDTEFPNIRLLTKHKEIENDTKEDIDLDSLIKCTKEDADVENEIQRSKNEALKIGATQTPYILIISKRFGINSRTSKVYSFEELEDIIIQVLEHSFQFNNS